VDHLEFTGEEEINFLKGSGTMPTLLPGAAFFLGMDWPPARKMIDSGLPLALASDFNPGSSPNGDMKLIMSLACIKLRMLPAEALNALTLNSAYAMGLESEIGSIDRGKKANIVITKEVPSMEYLPYAYGSQLIDKVILNGEILFRD
jgi:imidazolonepropionase